MKTSKSGYAIYPPLIQKSKKLMIKNGQKDCELPTPNQRFEIGIWVNLLRGFLMRNIFPSSNGFLMTNKIYHYGVEHAPLTS
ncbi:MAG: hypothetical protein ACJAS1_000536 [Oleiphilaceae bacterium]|jgi:hypothetical protein